MTTLKTALPAIVAAMLATAGTLAFVSKDARGDTNVRMVSPDVSTEASPPPAGFAPGNVIISPQLRDAIIVALSRANHPYVPHDQVAAIIQELRRAQTFEVEEIKAEEKKAE